MRLFLRTSWQYNIPHQDVLLLLPLFLFETTQLKIDYLAPKISLALSLTSDKVGFFISPF